MKDAKDGMAMRRWWLSLPIAAGLMVPGSDGPAAAEEQVFVCRNGDAVRRVQLLLAEAAGRAPCRVVYWKDTEQPGTPRVLWRAERSGQYCVDKALGLAERLSAAGWNCSGGGPAGEIEPAAAPAEPAPTPASLTTESAPPIAPAAAPPVDPAPPPSASTSESMPSVQPATAPTPVDTAPTPVDLATRSPSPVEPPEEPQATIALPLLQEAAARNVEQLNRDVGSGGSFTVVAAQLGDLDRDNVEDGVALLRFDPVNGQPSFFLLAYSLADGFPRPTAQTKLGSGAGTNATMSVEAGGTVMVTIPLRRSGDPACCATGSRWMGFALQDGMLVEVSRETVADNPPATAVQ